MKLRLLSMAGLVAVVSSACLVVACSDDDGVSGGGGSGGTSSGGHAGAGKGGTAGKGGDSNVGGEAENGGSAPEGGSGPAGGMSSGGKGGSGGSVSGGAGGASGGSAGMSGSAGKGGSGGASGGSGGASGGMGGAASGAGGTSAGAGGAMAGTGGAAAGAGGAAAGAGGAAAGAGGSGGAAAGAGGSGGAAAGAGGAAAGTGGSGGVGPLATGCTRFDTPFTAASQSGAMTAPLPSATNLAAATINTKLYINPVGSAATTGNLQYMLVGTIGSKTCTAYVGWTNSFAPYASTFGTYSINISTLPGVNGNSGAAPTAYCSDGTQAPFDGLQITAIGYQIQDGTATSPFTTNTLWVDSITITGSTPAVAAMTFDTSTTFTRQTYSGGPLSTATVTWAATCP